MQEQSSPKKDMTTAYLWISLSAFVLLWLAAMRLISFFDALVLFAVVACFDIGFVRGGVKEFFSFFGVLASLLFAVNGYTAFHHWTGFDFLTDNPFWGKLGWFLLLLGSGWIICRFLSYYLENAIRGTNKLKSLNRVLGAILGSFKGIVAGYIFVIIVVAIPFKYPNQAIEKQLKISYAGKTVQFLEERYGVLHQLENLELSNRMQQYFDEK